MSLRSRALAAVHGMLREDKLQVCVWNAARVPGCKARIASLETGLTTCPIQNLLANGDARLPQLLSGGCAQARAGEDEPRGARAARAPPAELAHAHAQPQAIHGGWVGGS